MRLVLLFYLHLFTLLSSCSILDRYRDPGQKETPQHPKLGVSVLTAELHSDKKYQDTVNQYFSSLTPENALKFEVVSPTLHQYNTQEADKIVHWARENHKQVRGHPLIWHRQLPKWLKDKTISDSEFKNIFESHIEKLVLHYKESIKIWDVINEAFNSDGTLRKSIWLNRLGPNYIKEAFELAHLNNPNAKLFYNDYDISNSSPKTNAVYYTLKKLISQNTPIHGIGFQMHFRPSYMPSEEEIREIFTKFSELGLEIHITELDIAIPNQPSKSDLKRQAQQYKIVANSCKAIKACTLISLWGLHDGVSWIPSHYKGIGNATLFDSRLNPKKISPYFP